jgi:hypothetical protein
MQAHSAAHRHRHFKTLMLLVVCMTVGAFFLFWLGQMTPVTPLRAKTLAAADWKQIAVRTAAPDAAPAGFFHLRIDEQGRLFQTNAWKAASHDPQRESEIQIVLTMKDNNTGISPAQERTLSRLIAGLRRDYAIAAEKIRLDSLGAASTVVTDPQSTRRGA